MTEFTLIFLRYKLIFELISNPSFLTSVGVLGNLHFLGEGRALNSKLEKQKGHFMSSYHQNHMQVQALDLSLVFPPL